MVRRFAMLIASLSVFLILTGAHHLLAQDEKKAEQKETVKKDEPKKDDTKKDEPKKDDTKKEEPKKDEVKKDEPKKEEVKKEEPLPPIPPEVEAKLKAARKAVAEAI